MSKKLISLFLIITLLTTVILGSYTSAESNETSDSTQEWEQYIGDTETFIYGLIIKQLEYVYDVFPAGVELPDGNYIYGIGYTDYSECYTDEDETVCCFDAGFIPYNGELPVSEEAFNSGLTITDLDYKDDKVSFRWAYGSDPFTQHCVVYNQYVQYGIDESGAIFYNTSEYTPRTCDEELGSLYSFDETKYLLDLDVGTYKGITGASLFSELDYIELEKEINRILATQDVNFASVDVVSCAYYAQEAICSYLLSLQGETFLGYRVSDLVEAANSLDPLECYRISSEGITTIELEEGARASDLTKWLVGTGCVILTAVALVGSMVFFECPPLSALSGAVAGSAIDIFMQVVLSEKDLNSLDWRKIATGAAAGAVSGFLGPYVSAVCGSSHLAYFLADSMIDGLIGGIEQATEAWMDGKDAVSVLKSFGYGVVIGAGLSAGFKGVASVFSKIASGLSPAVRSLAEKLPEKLTGKVSAVKKKIGDAIGNLKKAADSSIFHSEHLAKKIANAQTERLIRKNIDELVGKSLGPLSPNDIVNANGEAITKSALKNIATKAKNGTIIGYIKKGDALTAIVKENNVVSVMFDAEKYLTVEIPNGLTENRMDNFINAAKVFQKKWLENPSLIPNSLMQSIKNSGMDLEELLPRKIVSIIQESDWVIHENINMISVSLVPRGLHEEVRHMGGVALVKYIKSHLAINHFEQFISAAATGTVIALQ